MSGSDLYVIKDSNNGVLNTGLIIQDKFVDVCNDTHAHIVSGDHGWQPTILDGVSSRVSTTKLHNYILELYNVVAHRGYDNVLVIPNFTNSKYTFIEEQNGLLAQNIAPSMIAMMGKIFGGTTQFFTAFTEEQNFAKSLLRKNRCHVLISNKMYEMGDETYEITVPEGVEFDAVVLCGIDINEGESFSASDIKDDFASYCTSDFELMDIYADYDRVLRKYENNEEFLPEVDRLTGETKDLTATFDFINTYSIRKDGYGDDNFVNNRLPQITAVLQRSVKVY